MGGIRVPALSRRRTDLVGHLGAAGCATGGPSPTRVRLMRLHHGRVCFLRRLQKWPGSHPVSPGDGRCVAAIASPLPVAGEALFCFGEFL